MKEYHLKSISFLFLAFVSVLLVLNFGCNSGNSSKNENLTKEELRKKLDKKESSVIAASETLTHFVLEKKSTFS